MAFREPITRHMLHLPYGHHRDATKDAPGARFYPSSYAFIREAAGGVDPLWSALHGCPIKRQIFSHASGHDISARSEASSLIKLMGQFAVLFRGYRKRAGLTRCDIGKLCDFDILGYRFVQRRFRRKSAHTGLAGRGSRTRRRGGRIFAKARPYDPRKHHRVCRSLGGELRREYEVPRLRTSLRRRLGSWLRSRGFSNRQSVRVDFAEPKKRGRQQHRPILATRRPAPASAVFHIGLLRLGVLNRSDLPCGRSPTTGSRSRRSPRATASSRPKADNLPAGMAGGCGSSPDGTYWTVRRLCASLGNVAP